MPCDFDFRATVAATAATFGDEFPGQEPSRSWLAVAADVDHVPDARREEWFEAVCARVAASQQAKRALSSLEKTAPDGGSWTPALKGATGAMERLAAAQRLAAAVPHLSPRVWARGGAIRVYLTEPGHKRDSGYVDFSRAETGEVQCRLEKPHAAALRIALGRPCEGDAEIASKPEGAP